jgi:hypothetical protein
LSAVLAYSFENSVDSFLEPVLDIAHALLLYSSNSKSSEFLVPNQPLMEQCPLFIKLLLHSDSQVIIFIALVDDDR